VWCAPAGAAWALVQLRRPNAVVLGVLSRELLRPEPWLSEQQAFKLRQWGTAGLSVEQQQQQQQQGVMLQRLTAQSAGDAAAAAAGLRVGYSDADAWGSMAHPMPKALMQQQQQQQQQQQDETQGVSRRAGSSSSLEPASRRRRVLQGAVRQSGDAASPKVSSSSSSSSSSSGGGRVLGPAGGLDPSPAIGNASVGYVHSQRLLAAHPRVRQLAVSDVTKLVSSCCLAGWAPPQLFSGECWWECSLLGS
jgi:hypothetical protein